MFVRYEYNDFELAHTHSYLWPAIQRELDAHTWLSRRAFDLGCGNGATCRVLMDAGFDVIGVDPSESGVAIARRHGVRADVASAYDDLSSYGRFPLVLSLEVIAHCNDPRRFIESFLSLIEPGGVGIITTPYHGYLKNLALSITGRMDAHLNALWPGGQIKFLSIATLGRLLREQGMGDVRFERVGRIPPLAKSIVAIVRQCAV